MINVELNIPEYTVETEPDFKLVSSLVDDEIKKHFLGKNIVVRGIASSEHPDKTLDELLDIIKTTGTDRYDPSCAGDR